MRMQRQTFSRILLVLMSLWCLGFVVGPGLEHAIGDTHLVPSVYKGVCHQDPARSFEMFGTSWAVCHRCSAIYLSFMLVSALLILRDRLSIEFLPRPSVIVALLLPIIADGVTDLLGIRSADLVSRLITGILTGSLLALVVLPILYDALQKLSFVEPYPSPGGHDA